MSAAGGTRGFPFSQEPSSRSVAPGSDPRRGPTASPAVVHSSPVLQALRSVGPDGSTGSRSGNTWALSLLQLKDLQSPPK